MIDQARIEELKQEIGEDDLREVLDLFCDEVDDSLFALAEQKSTEIPNLLHALKGSALNIGMQALAAACLAEEENCKSAAPRAVNLENLKEIFAESRTELEASLSPS